MKIAQVLTQSGWGSVGPELFETGVGGREGALLRLSREWSLDGHTVENFVPRDDASWIDRTGAVGGGTEGFLPIDICQAELVYREYDAIIAWECPEVFAGDDIFNKPAVKLLEMQVAHLSPQTVKYASRADRVCVLSPWHGQFVVSDNPGIITAEQIAVLPNCIDPSLYVMKVDLSPEGSEKRRTGKLFHYTSSPDRGLLDLLQMWSRIRDIVPGAELHVGYNPTKWTSVQKWSHSMQGEMAADIEILLNLPGVVDRGLMGQQELADLHLSSSGLLYPCNSIQPTETGCITVLEAAAAGSPCFLTDADCLESEFASFADIVDLGEHFHERYLKAFDLAMGVPSIYHEMRRQGADFVKNRKWEIVAKQWIELIIEEKAKVRELDIVA